MLHVPLTSWHCAECGKCREGIEANYFHCNVCRTCLPVSMQNNHLVKSFCFSLSLRKKKQNNHFIIIFFQCIVDALNSECPTCRDPMNTGEHDCVVFRCSHSMHLTCFEELFASGFYQCPQCLISVVNMQEYWQFLDNEIAEFEQVPAHLLPAVAICCKDCHAVCKFYQNVVFFF